MTGIQPKTALLLAQLKELASEGLTLAEAARRIGRASPGVFQISKRYGIVFNTGPRAETRELMQRLRECCAGGMYRSQAAEHVGISPVYLHQLERRYGAVFPECQRGRKVGISNENVSRAAQMAALYKSGHLLREIGEKFGVTRERARQVIAKHHGMSGKNGGAHVQARRKQLDTHVKRDVKCLAKHGCTWAQYLQLRDMRKPTRAFIEQKRNASSRGIGWELTLWQWWTIWQESGHWDMRGRGTGYAMCRVNDTGPYAVGNVYIATCVQNIHDYYDRKRAEQVAA